MPRLARIVIPELTHHVTQRGNARRAVFFSVQDRQVYLGLLQEYSQHYRLRIMGYCLMTNHVHLIAVPKRADALTETLGRTHCDYARWLHVRERQTGHLWQNRFYSCPLDAGYCWAELRYVERNPVRATLTKTAEKWPWSGAQAHVTADDPAALIDWTEWKACWNPLRWKEALEKSTGDALLEERIRLATGTGRPLGTEGFTEGLEQVIQRPLIPAKRRRKACSQTATAMAA